jgi:hypothetical protein
MRTTRREISDLSSDKQVGMVADQVLAGGYFGTYFRDIGGNKHELVRLLLSSDWSPKGIFEALLRFDAARRNKSLVSGKFPIRSASAQCLFL